MFINFGATVVGAKLSERSANLCCVIPSSPASWPAPAQHGGRDGASARQVAAQRREPPHVRPAREQEKRPRTGTGRTNLEKTRGGGGSSSGVEGPDRRRGSKSWAIRRRRRVREATAAGLRETRGRDSEGPWAAVSDDKRCVRTTVCVVCVSGLGRGDGT